MDKTLEERIREDLEKTGYPTEIVTAAVMQSHGWFVLHNPSYLDDTEKRSREFDIRAYRTIWKEIEDQKYSFGFYLITECKKSVNPWVFFTTPEGNRDSRLGRIIKWSFGRGQAFTDNSNPSSLVSDAELRAYHHYFKNERLARTFHQPFRGEGKAEHSQMIYSAVMSAIKATIFLSKETPISNWLRVFYPVVIFSGPLFEARVGPNKSIELISSNYVQLSFHYMTPGSEETEFRVDIVHEDHLKNFLGLIKSEHEAISECLERSPFLKGSALKLKLHS